VNIKYIALLPENETRGIGRRFSKNGVFKNSVFFCFYRMGGQKNVPNYFFGPEKWGF
jgi:hypothetical protein